MFTIWDKATGIKGETLSILIEANGVFLEYIIYSNSYI
jgi:hypothetical protein